MVPEHYVPQVQILLEVFDLEVCDFVQYRPESDFELEQMDVTVIQRDREWFARALPVMKEFMEDVEAIKSGRLSPPEAPEKLGLKRRRVVTPPPKVPPIVDIRRALLEDCEEGADASMDAAWEFTLEYLEKNKGAVPEERVPTSEEE